MRKDAVSINRYAKVAGLAYLIIITAGIFAEFFVRSRLIVWGDASATARNITGSELLFRSAVASEFVMLVCDVLVALVLLVVFEGVSRSLALLAAFLRLVHAAVVAGNLLNTYVPLLLLSDSSQPTGFSAAQLHALVLVFLQAHSYGYVIGLVFFGVQCLVLGYLVFQSGFVPKVLGVLLVLGGAGYLIDGFARTLISRYDDYQTIFAVVVFVPAFVGELSFAAWLLVKGVNEAAVNRRLVAAS